MIRKVLVGLDGTAVSERSLPWVQRIAPGARIVLGGAYTPVPVGIDPWMDAASFVSEKEHVGKYLKSVAAGCRPAPRIAVGRGAPAGVLLELARQERCDLISIATRGGSQLKRRLFGGTTENLLHHSAIPLLVIPGAGKAPRAHAPIRRIAIPLDGSKLAETILPWACRMAREHQAELLLIHCFLNRNQMVQLYESWGTPALSGFLTQDLERRVTDYRRTLENHLMELSSKLKRRHLRSRVVGITGSFPEGIVKAARHHHADFFMLCAHGHGALRHLLQGSMISKLIQESTIPVLVQRSTEKPPKYPSQD